MNGIDLHGYDTPAECIEACVAMIAFLDDALHSVRDSITEHDLKAALATIDAALS